MAKTKANVGAPPGSPGGSKDKAPRRRLQMSIPTPGDIGNNLTTPNSDILDLNFKVPSAFHRAFKTEAAVRGISMRELLEQSFKCFLDTHGKAMNDIFGR